MCSMKATRFRMQFKLSKWVVDIGIESGINLGDKVGLFHVRGCLERAYKYQ